MANYLMLLSRGSNYMNSSNNRVFECKTCNRQFQSFQALGGHRASHKKPRLMGESDHNNQVLIHGSPPKPKTHECSICGLEFAIGQALGGHMRRHRASSSSSSSNGNMHTNSLIDLPNRNNKAKRVLFPDLNLTPLENDLEFLKIGQATPLVQTGMIHVFKERKHKMSFLTGNRKRSASN
ncbi:Zinc finger protein ZAT12, partial [Mucuna pruriens]